MHIIPSWIAWLIVAYPFSMIVGMICAVALKWWSYK